MIKFRFPATKIFGPFDLYWYDGGMKPLTPDELTADGKSFDREGMMFVGDKGKILAEFRGENPRLIPESKMAAVTDKMAEVKGPSTNEAWIDGFRNNKQTPGISFLQVR
jgi:hypothetical protein